MKGFFVGSDFNIKQLSSRKRGKEVVLAGRSNVGKSSLINHLFGSKGLAKVSSVPGKTRSINFYSFESGGFLVDLPGFGFAARSKKERAEWGELLEAFFQEGKDVRLLIHLVDLRHLPSKDDLSFLQWAKSSGWPFLIVFTKADKLPASKRESAAKKAVEFLNEELGEFEIPYMLYSIKEAKGKAALSAEIKKALNAT